MTRILPFLGSEQLEVMSVVASFLLLLVQFITSSIVKERVLLSSTCVLEFIPSRDTEVCAENPARANEGSPAK
jgi:hypothetical protein